MRDHQLRRLASRTDGCNFAGRCFDGPHQSRGLFTGHPTLVEGTVAVVTGHGTGSRPGEKFGRAYENARSVVREVQRCPVR